MYTEKNRADFVLYTSDEIRRAIRFVNLFFSLIGVVGREMSHDTINLGDANLHAHFPVFIEHLSPPLAESEKFYYQWVGITCPAVGYHRIAYSRSIESEKVVAQMFYLHHPIDQSEKEIGIMREARKLGVPEHMTYEEIKGAARAALEKMLGIQI